MTTPEEKIAVERGGFEEFTKRIHPILTHAFKTRLSEMTDELPLRESAFFESAVAGGKMIRGCLLCLVADCLGATDETVIPRAVAVELIQAASLLHDDFVDQDTVRRNQSAIWTVEGAKRAVLMGDLLFASAIKMMADLGREDGATVSEAIARMARGAVREPLDPQHILHELTSDAPVRDLRYETIIDLKTGALFGAACRLGAIAASTGPGMKEKSEKYGMLIGEAYQIEDDRQEMAVILDTHAVPAKAMVSLAPALLTFVPEARTHIAAIMKEHNCAWSDAIAGCFGAAIVRMEEQVVQRLQLARAQINDVFPQNEAGLLVRRAPWDLLRMFRQSRVS